MQDSKPEVGGGHFLQVGILSWVHVTNWDRILPSPLATMTKSLLVVLLNVYQKVIFARLFLDLQISPWQPAHYSFYCSFPLSPAVNQTVSSHFMLLECSLHAYWMGIPGNGWVHCWDLVAVLDQQLSLVALVLWLEMLCICGCVVNGVSFLDQFATSSLLWSQLIL